MTAPRGTLDYLDDILDAVEKIEIFTRGMSYEEFSRDDKTVYAVTRALEVIGEAAKCIPRSVRENYPGNPWTEMAGMRDKLIHAYFGINRAIIWISAGYGSPSRYRPGAAVRARRVGSSCCFGLLLIHSCHSSPSSRSIRS